MGKICWIETAKVFGCREISVYKNRYDAGSPLE
jgi:hypothetical protein